ncbi:MAG: hypothetical protein KDK70_25075, partial [Myxococcales bacterium]|nr:hypothetical protein [Myxococcales bacterium]
MTSSIKFLRSSLPLAAAALLAGLAFSACDLPNKDLGDDPPGDTEGAACQDGDSMMQDCNSCTCEGGFWACTEIACPEDPPVAVCD